MKITSFFSSIGEECQTRRSITQRAWSSCGTSSRCFMSQLDSIPGTAFFKVSEYLSHDGLSFISTEDFYSFCLISFLIKAMKILDNLKTKQDKTKNFLSHCEGRKLWASKTKRKPESLGVIQAPKMAFTLGLRLGGMEFPFRWLQSAQRSRNKT